MTTKGQKRLTTRSDRALRAKLEKSAVYGKQQDDPVDHPNHYTSHPSGVECIAIIEHMPYNVGAAIGYLWRHQLKGNPIQDLQKAAWHINREIQRIESSEVAR